jgi:ABC-type multidrug transport system fused ATPase/permease subunit
VTVLYFYTCGLLICNATTPEQVVLKNFNLRLPVGKTVAVVGSSGNGKSTIAALLERYVVS